MNRLQAHLDRAGQVRRFVSLLTAVVLASCGGGGDSSPSESSQPDVHAAGIAAPAAAQWSPLIPLTLIPAAAANLPNGKLLFWASYARFTYGGTGQTYTDIFDPATQVVTENLVSQTNHDMFCPGTANLSDGSVLVNGGEDSARTSVYNALTGVWTASAQMNIPRGYEANTVLQDGSVLTLGGSWSGGYGGKNGEIWSAANGWKLLPGVPVDSALGPDPGGIFRADNHFWMFSAPNGKVLQAGPSAIMNWIGTQGNGDISTAGTRADDAYSINGNAVMYDIGKILKVGGAPAYEQANATNSAYVIDINHGVAVRKLAPMTYPRAFSNSVVLPNGQVLVIGGMTFAVPFSDDTSVLVPELWDPATEAFTPMPPIAVGRNYHSVALLMPDGRVVSGGGGLCGDGCAANHPDVQILTPHYLFNEDGTPATRPVITAAPTTLTQGTTIVVTTDSPIASFALIRMGSATHSINNDQRRIPLQFTSTGANAYSLALPSNPGVAVPGYYMLFALNAAGVPSVSKIVQLTGNGAPKLGNPGTQTAFVGAQPQLTILATPASGSVAFSAAGLPPGLQIDAVSGVVTGAPGVEGTYDVTLSATDAAATTSTQFRWIVSPPQAAVQYVRLEADTEVNGNAWTSMAEFNLLDTTGAVISRTGWTVSADSAETVAENDAASNAIDGNPATFWHTQWQGSAPLPPHTFTVNLGTPQVVGGFKYLPRSDGSANGNIASWRFLTSADGLTWVVAATGLFTNSTTEKTVYPLAGGAVNQSPSLNTIAKQTGTVGNAVSLTLSGSDPENDPLTYSASGLPTGTSINAASGSITGTLTAAGTFNVTATVSDNHGGSASSSFVWTVAAASATNHPPTLAAVADQSSTVGQTISLAMVAADADNDKLSYTATGLPAGLKIAATTGLITGKPTAAGVSPVNVTVSDGHGGTALRSFAWTVVPANHAPTLAAVSSKTGIVGQTAALALVGADADGDALTYTATGLPTGLAIDAPSGAISGTFGAAGTFNVTATVNDGRGGTASRAFVWTVTVPVNHAPTLAAVTSKTGTVGQAASLALVGADSDGDPLTYTATNLPTGTSINSATGLISGTLTAAGTYSVTATVSDGRGGSASRTFTWTVTVPANHAPTLAVVASQTGTVGQAAALTLVGADADGDALTYTATSLPPGATVNAATGVVLGTFTTSGVYSVTAKVSDGRGGTASRAFVWTVLGAGGAATTNVQYVRLEADSEINGNPYTSMAEFNLLDATGAVMPRTGWAATADSAELVGENAPASNAIDGDTTTYWHTQWQGAMPAPPHTFTVNLGVAHTVTGFKYMPRTDGYPNGTILAWRFFTSVDGSVWNLVAQGSFAKNTTEKTVLLP